MVARESRTTTPPPATMEAGIGRPTSTSRRRATTTADTTSAGSRRASGSRTPSTWLHPAPTAWTRAWRRGQPAARFHIELNRAGGYPTGTLTIPDTGGWQTWTTMSTSVYLSPGIYVMRVVFDAAGPGGDVGNLNFLRFTAREHGDGVPRIAGGHSRENRRGVLRLRRRRRRLPRHDARKQRRVAPHRRRRRHRTGVGHGPRRRRRAG